MLFAQHTESGVGKLWNMPVSNSLVNTLACPTYVTQFSYWWTILMTTTATQQQTTATEPRRRWAFRQVRCFFFQINCGFYVTHVYDSIVKWLQSTKNRRSLKTILLSTNSKMAFINTILIILKEDNVIKNRRNTKSLKLNFGTIPRIQ